ncbi:MAG TPA: DNA polymerase III subunit gamma/tau [Gammaproteobacteria bacterium]|nr:DNA polymerase III subunit gamma/tau [Gammaproteobacteria bacterium]
MAYLALARRYRPRRFADVVGQGHVVRALSNALDQGRLHHAYLFEGTRGVGKTTIARIITQCLNCEKGVSSTPCGECGTCKAIESGRFVDFVELDAASRTGVDDMRDLLESTAYTPAEGRYKVYLIDEVHMLSKNAFNALLKTLEEPPEHVKFLFATTEPEKVPQTVLSRCLVFALHHLPGEEIQTALDRIVHAEGLEAEPAALAELARAAHGSMRDALTLLDQVLAFGGGTLKREDVVGMLGVADRDRVYDLLDGLAVQDGTAVLEHIGELGRGVAGADSILDTLAEVLTLIARRQIVSGAPLPAGSPEHRIDALAGSLTPEEIQLDYDIVLRGKADVKLAEDPILGLEMVALRLLAFQPRKSGGQGAPKKAPAPASPGPSNRVTENRPAERTASPASPRAVSAADASWEDTVPALGLKGMGRELAQNCVLLERSDTLVRLGLDRNKAHLLTDRLRGTLEKALTAHYGTALKLKVEIGERAGPSPAAKKAEEAASKESELRRAIEDDPHVNALRETFGAEMLPDTLRSEDRSA